MFYKTKNSSDYGDLCEIFSVLCYLTISGRNEFIRPQRDQYEQALNHTSQTKVSGPEGGEKKDQCLIDRLFGDLLF